MKSICLLPFVLASVMGGTTLLATPYAVAPAVAPAAVAYSNVNLNVPAPVPAGEAPAPELLVQRTPVKALGRPVISYTPQVTEVRPELKIIEKTYDVAVPKPVYETKEVTPIQHKYVPEPYAVPQPYAVHQPIAVPQPYAVPVPVHEQVHVQHHVAAAPAAVTYGAAHGVVAQGAVLGAAHGVVAQGAVVGAHPVTYGATHGAVIGTPLTYGATHAVVVKKD
ncbi:E3 ubiquitin-protein ligase RNF12-B-like [Penaeus indicus]|uniref:E3 ubiquitin-protein ligase RNF12-B-like n=1 Tax=Penaeus indicus TaxID=29960 RepID=UPI00300D7A63